MGVEERLDRIEREIKLMREDITNQIDRVHGLLILLNENKIEEF